MELIVLGPQRPPCGELGGYNVFPFRLGPPLGPVVLGLLTRDFPVTTSSDRLTCTGTFPPVPTVNTGAVVPQEWVGTESSVLRTVGGYRPTRPTNFLQTGVVVRVKGLIVFPLLTTWVKCLPH